MEKRFYLTSGLRWIAVLYLTLVISVPQSFALASLQNPHYTGKAEQGIVISGNTSAPFQSSTNSQIFFPILLREKGGGQSGNGDWPTAGANPQRTSWTPEEVRGNIKPIWYKQFEPYIPPKVQIVAANNTLYISTANGLYALDAQTGAEKWVYPTEMPLGHSPTISNGVAYVGGYDKKLHAVDANTGTGLWTFEAGAGFDTNPLVAEGKVLLGNRDGFFYAIYTGGNQAGQLAWKFQTGGPIDYSAAYQDGDVFFASNDSYAYALSARDGSLKWKSAKLPGAGFHSWWPVVYRDWVIFSGSMNYRNTIKPGPTLRINSLERNDIYPNFAADPKGTLAGPLGAETGDWVSGTPTIDFSQSTITANGSTFPVTEYFEQKPWRRSYFVLNRATGQEYTSDFDHDGKPEYAPILWQGTMSGNRYPPVVGSDGVIYQSNNYMSSPGIAGGQISGWKIGTPFISVASGDWNAIDEPQAYAAGGNLIYWNLCCDRKAGAFDITIPNTQFAQRYNNGARPPTGINGIREWYYFSYFLEDVAPGYSTRYYNGTTISIFGAFGNRNGLYGVHGNQNPPIPYAGNVYMHRSNAVLAFGPSGSNHPAALPMARIVPVQNQVSIPTRDQAKVLLAIEVNKMITAGHLRPGYSSAGNFDFRGSRWCGDKLIDYWHSPGDTIYTLIRALPHLPLNLQTQTRTYLQSEFALFPPYIYSHIGWDNGAAREFFLLPKEVENDLVFSPPQKTVYGFAGWTFPPQSFYSLWKYAQVFGGAKTIFDAAKGNLNTPPSVQLMSEMPNVHNAYIAGYIGYLELEKLAGYPESAAVRQELNRLLSLRAVYFSKDTPDSFFTNSDLYYCRSLGVSRNFMEMVPEEAQFLNANASPKIQGALSEYLKLAPYWFVTRFDTTFAEGGIHHFFDYYTLFQAKAWFQGATFSELARYLDVPAVPVGDLFYIQNLVTAIEAGG